MTFPQQLKAERTRLRLTQDEAARLLGVSKSALSKWETGEKTPLPLTQEGALARMRAIPTPYHPPDKPEK